MANQKEKIQVLIAYEGRLFPFKISHPASKKFLELAESTDDGIVGDFFYQTLKEAKAAISACMDERNTNDETKMKSLFQLGYKIETKQHDDYREHFIIDDPIRDDGGNPAY